MWRKILVPTVLSLVFGLIFITFAEAALNLANDPRLYQYSKYTPKKHFRTSLQIKVTDDKRPEEERVKHETAPYYVYDSLWSDFVESIVCEVLAREFGNAKMFDAVDVRDENSRYLLAIELNSFAGRIEAPSGFRSVYQFFGIVDLQVKLISRKGGKVLFTKRYKERSKSMLSQFKAWNKYGYGARELGKALQMVAVKVMKDVETAMAGGRVSQY